MIEIILFIADFVQLTSNLQPNTVKGPILNLITKFYSYKPNFGRMGCPNKYQLEVLKKIMDLAEKNYVNNSIDDDLELLSENNQPRKSNETYIKSPIVVNKSNQN